MRRRVPFPFSVSVVPICFAPAEELKALFNEFVQANEYCHPLWRMHEDEGFKKDEIDFHASCTGERVFLLFINDTAAGVFRITPRPKNVANGMTGFALRPSIRGNGYGNVLVQYMSAMCRLMLNTDEVTAVVNDYNMVSRITLESSGWKRTGNEYRWNDGSKAIEYHLVR